jgi:CRP-like cAMP-binding protein
MIEAHLAKLRLRFDISPEQEEAIRDSVSEVRPFGADEMLVRAGEPLDVSMLLLDGWLARVRDLLNGQRQVTEVHVAGDFADLHSFTLKRLDHNVMSLTPCRLALVPHDRLEGISRDYPHLTRLLWFSTNLDAAIHRQWVLSLGRRTALARIAHLFCELHVRLGIVGLTRELEYGLELTQADLAECMGLTAVHVNRTLKELREQGLVEFRASTVRILDLAGLRRVAEFDPEYLYLDRRGR